MAKMPDFKIKGKSIQVKFNEELIPNTTYSVYFGDAIIDITEKNPLSNYIYIFSTGKFVDSLSVFGKVINTDTSIKTPFDVLESLNGSYEKVIFVVGSDRVSEFKRNMSKYVDSDLEDIKDFSVVSAGDRDPDAEGVSGMSGSKMREFVIKDEFSKFKEGLMTKNARLAKAVFNEIGKKLK